MAQAKKKQPPSKVPERLTHLAREASAFVTLVLAGLLFLVLFSHDNNDPGWSLTGSNLTTQNLVGIVGAYLSDVLLYSLGYLAYLLPIALVGLALFVFRAQKSTVVTANHVGLWFPIVGFVLLLLAGSALATLHLFRYETMLPWYAGGVLGNAVAMSLVKAFGFVGATLLLFAMLVIGSSFFFRFSWLQLMDGLGQLARQLLLVLYGRYQRLQQANEVRQEKKQRTKKFTRAKKVLDDKPAPKIEPTLLPIEKSDRGLRDRQTQLFGSLGGELPGLSLLDSASPPKLNFSAKELDQLSRLLEIKLKEFNVDVSVCEVHPGPIITRFELELAAGLRASKVSGLAQDLARSLSLPSVRVVEVIPGKPFVGVEIPNHNREMVRLREILESKVFEAHSSSVAMVLGKDIAGGPVVVDLAKMPHLLVAGTTGSGKSVGINGMIISMLYKSTPSQVRFIMIDPKMLELSVYDAIPHLLTPVVTDMSKAANALQWCVVEMDRRYALMKELGVRSISGFNKKVEQAIKKGEPIPDPLHTIDPLSSAEVQATIPLLEPLPIIVVVIDELADMLMIVGKKVEQLIARLAQKARAAGIHLILATQRPSVDVLTGLIKSNIPTRISFQVSSKIDSRTILDQMGAENLLGQGDMLFLPPGGGIPERVHGAFVSDEEVLRVADQVRSTAEPKYVDEILNETYEADFPTFVPGAEGEGSSGERDEYYDKAVAFVTEKQEISISKVQRYLGVGYNRSANLVEAMEAAGIVSVPEHNGRRKVLAPPPPSN